MKLIRLVDQTPNEDPGNPTITFRGEVRSNQAHRVDNRSHCQVGE
jgi:hypothetical protein